jgi:hypothetical protein
VPRICPDRVQQSVAFASRAHLGEDLRTSGAARRLDPVVTISQPADLAVVEDNYRRELIALTHCLGVFPYNFIAQGLARLHFPAQVVDEDRSWIEPIFGSFAHGPLRVIRAGDRKPLRVDGS